VIIDEVSPYDGGTCGSGGGFHRRRQYRLVSARTAAGPGPYLSGARSRLWHSPVAIPSVRVRVQAMSFAWVDNVSSGAVGRTLMPPWLRAPADVRMLGSDDGDGRSAASRQFAYPCRHMVPHPAVPDRVIVDDARIKPEAVCRAQRPQGAQVVNDVVA
jgi:hypothetical protein